MVSVQHPAAAFWTAPAHNHVFAFPSLGAVRSARAAVAPSQCRWRFVRECLQSRSGRTTPLSPPPSPSSHPRGPQRRRRRDGESGTGSGVFCRRLPSSAAAPSSGPASPTSPRKPPDLRQPRRPPPRPASRCRVGPRTTHRLRIFWSCLVRPK